MLRMRSVVALLLLAAGLPAAGAATATATTPVQGRIVHGTMTDIRDVPWQVSVFSRTAGGGGYDCGGSIIGETTVITAAHCVDEANVGVSQYNGGLGVIAGASNNEYALGTDDPQEVTVASARIHPMWRPQNGVFTSGDVAVLTLRTPLDLSGPTAQAIALPPAATIVDADPIVVGPSVSVSGFGLQDSTMDPNGYLYALNAAIVDSGGCNVPDNAISLCVRSPIGVACSGDSGGPLVTRATGVPLLVGVVSNGPADCAPGDFDNYVNLMAPENRQFIDGNDVPPLAPRVSSPASISVPPVNSIVGNVTCRASFTGSPTAIKYTLVDTNDGRVLATSREATLTYRVQAADVGHRAACKVSAANAGGVAESGPSFGATEMHQAQAIGGFGPGGSSVPSTPGAAGTVVTKPRRLADAAFKATARRSARRGELLRVNLSLTALGKLADTATLCTKLAHQKADCQALVTRGQEAVTQTVRIRVPRKARKGSTISALFTVTLAGKDGFTGAASQENRSSVVRVRVGK